MKPENMYRYLHIFDMATNPHQEREISVTEASSIPGITWSVTVDLYATPFTVMDPPPCYDPILHHQGIIKKAREVFTTR